MASATIYSSSQSSNSDINLLPLSQVNSEEQWRTFFESSLELQPQVAKKYSKHLYAQEVNGKTVCQLIENQTLIDLMALKTSHYLKLLSHIKQTRSQQSEVNNMFRGSQTKQNSSSGKVPTPKILPNSSERDYDIFLFKWNIYKKHLNLGKDAAVRALYLTCPDEIQDRVLVQMGINDIIEWDENKLLAAIKEVATNKVSKIIHIQQFHSMNQKESETINEFVQKLYSKASSCKFMCSSCMASTQESHIKSRFLLGLHNKEMQAELLKVEAVSPNTPLQKLINEALTIEQSIKDQSNVNKERSIYALKDEKKNESIFYMSQNYKTKKNLSNLCRNCGNNFSPTHLSQCPARNVRCLGCNNMGHFKKMCRSQNRARRNNPFNKRQNNNHIRYVEDEEEDTNSLNDESIGYMMVSAIGNSPLTEISVNFQTVLDNGAVINAHIHVLPDTGANINLMGPKQIKILGIKEHQMNNSKSILKVAGGTNMKTTKQVCATIKLQDKHTKTTVYFSDSVQRFFLSRQCCIALGIVPETFPHPPKQCFNVDTVKDSPAAVPNKPNNVPFDATSENIPRLREFLVNKFTETVFNRRAPFPKLSTPPAKIHLKENYTIPKPAYVPAVVAEHWAKTAKESIDRDVQAGILLKVPLNEPTVWCSRMVLVKKKDGSPRRTVDYQALNRQCVREPVYNSSPFHTARQIPSNTWKSVFDATDGYHSVELEEESSKLTTFITPWGRYRYLRYPQGHCGAGDAFNARVEQILSKIPRLVRIVDDMCIHDDSIKNMFWHAWNLLETCANHGIVLNERKFQFCKKTIDFAGLTITAASVQPSEKILAAIRDFPPPTDLTKARAFFGLTNQVMWAYSNSKEMAPFRSLVKPNSSFIWTEELRHLFNTCKEKIIEQVHDGVMHFDLHRPTCLQTDFSKIGLGYLLLQKHCSCSMEYAPICCKEGWQLVFAGSRFTKGAETRYAPTEGELLAIAWGLNHSRIFTRGSPNLTIVTDHKPLLGILNEKPLNAIKNPRIIRLKEQTFSFNFKMRYNKGKWQRGPDALSRNPQCNSLEMFMEPDQDDYQTIEEPDGFIALAELNEVAEEESISMEDVIKASKEDTELVALSQTIQDGFPATHELTNPTVRQYFPVRNDLSICENGTIMFQERLVIPKSLRKQVLRILHHAHQGIEGMRSRARNTVYWPGLNSAIKQKRLDCTACNTIAPSQPKEPLCLLPQPQYPFQFICMDAFELKGQNYLAVADKFSGWILVYHCKSGVTSAVVASKLRTIFESYGAAERLYTDGGLPFASKQVEEFLGKWRVQHLVSSANYPQSNGRAELAVKTAKRIIMNNTGPGGTLDCDKTSRALLQYRNTPIKYLGLSPAQLLFHRHLRDSLPTVPTTLKLHGNWDSLADAREQAFRQRNNIMTERYNGTAKDLPALPIGCEVRIQEVTDRGKWSRYGTIVDRLGRKYTIRVFGSGRVITRNRKFLKPARITSSA